jgi:hypothetical protein
MIANSQDKKRRCQNDLITYPADYKIIVQGKLDISWSERLSGMTISITGGKTLIPTTTLRGNLVDQSALLGVLNTLHDLQHGILLVEHISQTGTNDAGNN